MPLTTMHYDLAARVHAAALQALAAPAPTPTPTGTPFNFDWSKIHPDPDQIPKNGGLFYDIANGLLFLGAIAALSGLVAGAIAFGVGPIFGAHIVSDRGKSMMWKSGLVAVIVGSATSITAWLLSK
ncbi:hypothetical protein [Actinoplanes sp. HUAS TT8]|uniref:hypothetical protein n=1 Tax=Actinoplanes sp. HUAS TT8 TaxID=3447453 RepID=UPI003F522190